MQVNYDEKTKELTIKIQCTEPRPSASGKTLVVASSHGNVATSCIINGLPLTIGLNAYIRNLEYKK